MKDSNPIFDGTREEWLTLAALWIMQDMILPVSHNKDSIPDWRVSVGYPKGSRGGKNTAIGACHPTSHSSDNTCEVFISPACEDSMQVLETLAHEMIHVENNCRDGHTGPFKRLALEIGLTGKMTATVAGQELREAFEWWLSENGNIPHAKMYDDKRKKQSTRMIKVHCTHCEKFTARASRTVATNWQNTEDMCPICQQTLTFEL
jgi:hypothetical protein